MSSPSPPPSSAVTLTQTNSSPHTCLWSRRYEDLELITLDGARLQSSRVLLALSSKYLPVLKEQFEQESLAVTVELSVENLQTVLDFAHHGVIPMNISTEEMVAFRTMGVELPEKEFSRVERPDVEGEEVTEVKKELPELDDEDMQLLAADGKAEPVVRMEGEEDLEEALEEEEWNEEDPDYVAAKEASEESEMEEEEEEEEDEDETSDEEFKLLKLSQSRKRSKGRRAKKAVVKPETSVDGGKKEAAIPGACTICRTNFRNLPQHMENMHSLENTTCDKCGKVYKDKTKRDKHVGQAHQECCCEICGKVLANKVNYEAHKLGVHGSNEDRPYKCDKCPRTFIFKGKLNEHMKGHNEVKPYVCDQCGRSFHSQTRLSMHIKQHNIKEEKVEIDELVKGADGVVRRRRRHFKRRTTKKMRKNAEGEMVEIKPRIINQVRLGSDRVEEISRTEQKCTVCERKFVGACSYQRACAHVVAKHFSEEEKPFGCHLCGKRYAVESALQYHMDIHENKKSHACSYCDARFNFAGNRNAHERSVHMGIKKTGLVRTSRRRVGCVKADQETAEERKQRWMKAISESAAAGQVEQGQLETFQFDVQPREDNAQSQLAQPQQPTPHMPQPIPMPLQQHPNVHLNLPPQ